MRILAIADNESSYLWDHYEKDKLADVDLILSAGDLSADYLSFLTTMYNVPVLYVHGNHDHKYEIKPPEGCVCIDDDIYVFEGIRIMGLGGSMRYSRNGIQYTENEMRARVRRLWRKILRHRGFDILLTHAPAYQVNDGSDPAHIGFEIFLRLLERYSPKFFIHGHVHKNYGRQHVRFDKYKNTIIINAYERCKFDYESSEEELSRIPR